MSTNPPVICRIKGHSYEHVYAYGNESIGHVVVICKRRNCGHITRDYFETNVKEHGDGYGPREGS